MSQELTLLAALRIESRALGGATHLTGMGKARAERAACRLLSGGTDFGPVAMAGVAGGLDPTLRTGEMIVASELRTVACDPPIPLPTAPLVAGELARLGLRVRLGPLVSSPKLVLGDQRQALCASGALAVDMESAYVMGPLDRHPRVVVRTVSDTGAEGFVRGGVRALRALRKVRPVLQAWAEATGPGEVALVDTLPDDHGFDLVLIVGGVGKPGSC